MNCEEKPAEYEFNRLEFGVNSSPLLAQFVCQSALEPGHYC